MARMLSTMLMHCHFCGQRRKVPVRIITLTPPSPRGGATVELTVDVSGLEAHLLTVGARAHRGPVHLVGAHG